MGRLNTAVILVVAGVLIGTGCGGSKSTSTSSHHASSSAGADVTKTQATAYAHAVNLKPGDVPELTAAGAEREASPKKGAEEGARCSGAPSPSARVANIDSAKFRGSSAAPLETISSEVVVWPSSAIAERNAAAQTGPRGRACAQHLLERLALKTLTSRVRLASSSISWLPAPLHGARGSYAAHVTMNVTAESPRTQTGASSAVLESSTASERKLQVPVYLDIQGFQSGPAQVTLTALGVKRPPSSSAEHRLLSLLYSRATTHTP
jgi:hypothetical protein